MVNVHLMTQQTGMSAKSVVMSDLSALQRALGDDVDDLKSHHDFAGLINYLDERGDRAAIGF